MDLHNLVRSTEKLLRDNSPAILTACGSMGVVTTAYLTGRASFKAAQIIEIEETKKGGMHIDTGVRRKERFKLVWKLYIPPVGMGTVTIACIVLANRIGSNRAAAVAAAYSISERAFSEYKEKVIERIGDKKEEKIRDEIAEERVRSNPVGKNEVVITGGGEVLCYDMYTGRYFNSSMETLKKAQNDVNYMILNSYYASLSDFYDKIGLHRTKTSDEVGWNADKMLELKFTTTMSDDQRPCIAIDFSVSPIRDYHRLR